MQGLVEEAPSIGSVLNSGFGERGEQYRHSTECRVWWRKCAVLAQYLMQGSVEEVYRFSTECRVWWKRGEVLKGSVEEGRSIGTVLNAEFSGKGAKY
jgi:hypothetical protein